MEDLEVQLLELTAKRDWKKILQLRECFSLNEKARFLWAWPSENCLQKWKNVLEKNCVHSIVSIGCGSGLLEWILRESTGLSVSGVELSRSMWASNISPSKFIKLNFIETTPTTKYLRDCSSTVDNNFALLFCYFNFKSAFDQYMEAYDGNWVIIVGPRNDCGIVTDPLPLNPNFAEYNGSQWVLESVIDIDVDDCNVVAVYRRE